MISITAKVCSDWFEEPSGTDNDVSFKFSTMENDREVFCATRVLDTLLIDDWESGSNKRWDHLSGNKNLGNCTASPYCRKGSPCWLGRPFRPTEGLKFKILLEGDQDDKLHICKLTVTFGNNLYYERGTPNEKWGWIQTWEWNGGEWGKVISTEDKESENWFEMQMI